MRTLSDLSIPFAMDHHSKRMVYFNAEIVNGCELFIENKTEKYIGKITGTAMNFTPLELRVNFENRSKQFFFEDQYVIQQFLADMGLVNAEGSSNPYELLNKQIIVYVSKDESPDIIGISRD